MPKNPLASPRYPKKLAVLGCSGSIGTSTLDIVRAYPDKFLVEALSVNTSVKKLVELAREFKPKAVGVCDVCAAKDPVLQDLPFGTKLYVGPKATTELAHLDALDIVVNALVGFAGIYAGFAALKAGKTVAYANKESIVVGGDLLMPLTRVGNLIPVDSEHSAIFQCLCGEDPATVARLWLTCSGGPFFGMSRSELAHVSAADALKHPTWSMGDKITIDSATLMNKGFEIIEAHHLFEVPYTKISVAVHRESKIHSMVEFSDGSVKAQLGPTDMKLPIMYALGWPERLDAVTPAIDWARVGSFSFDAPDKDAFGLLDLAKEAGERGGTLPCVLNAVNEVTNEAFRNNMCSFLDIERICKTVLDSSVPDRVESLEQLEEIDKAARLAAKRLVVEGL